MMILLYYSLASNTTLLNNLNYLITRSFYAIDGYYRCPKIITFPDVTHVLITCTTNSAANYGPVLACGTFGMLYFYIQGTNIPDIYKWESETEGGCSVSLDGLVTTITTGNRWSHTMIMVGGNLANCCTVEGQANV